jgi:hypothetical protein
MTTDVLIHTLAQEIAAVKPIASVRVRFFRWTVFAAITVVAGAFALGCRQDLPVKINDPAFLMENTALLLFFAFSSMSAMLLSVPGLEKPRFAFALPFLALILWAAFVGFRFIENLNVVHSPSTKSGIRCVWRILTLGTLPAAFLFLMLRKAAPLKTAWTGWFVSAAAFSLACLATQFICPNDRPLHILKWHVLPVFVLACIGAFIGKAIYKRKLKIPV